MEEILSLTRLAIVLALMSYAAILDWRTRRVANWVWMLMGLLGMGLMFIELLYYDNAAGISIMSIYGSTITGQMSIHQPALFLVFIPIGIFFFDVFWDREPVYHKGKINFLPILLYIVAFLAMAIIVYLEGTTEITMLILSVPVMILVFIIFYYARLIHGGADAKAFMALAIMFPYYPVLRGLPLIDMPVIQGMNLVFPFAFLILMNAAILQVVTMPMCRFFKNLAKRDFGFPEMLFGYRMDIALIPKRFVWPMEKIIDNELVLVLFPKRGGDGGKDIALLKEQGIDRIWVTPKDPFIIPILLGIIFSVIIGNLMMLFF